MNLEDVLSYVEANSAKEQTQDYITLDLEFLSVLSYWVKFDQKRVRWREEILLRFGSFPFMLAASQEELREILHLSDKDIATVKLFHEAALRLLKSRIYGCDIIQHKAYLIEYLIALIGRESIEHFILYFLDKQNHIINNADYRVQGTVDTTAIYIREVARNALQYQAASLILVHNHPSGVVKPSEADKQLTLFIIQALDTINIGISDHFVIGNGTYYSFAESGLLNPHHLKKIRPP